MILELSIENYRSIKNELTIPFEPSLRGKVTESETLHSLLIYGANGSGKSNICRAIRAFVRTLRSATELNRGQKIPGIEPFRLDPATRKAPTKFGVRLTKDGAEWEYKIHLTEDCVVFESLRNKKTSKRARWRTVFERSGPDAKTWRSQVARVNRKFLESVRDNASILSKAASEEIPIVAAVYDEIAKIKSLNMALPPISIVPRVHEICESRPDLRRAFSELVRVADIHCGELIPVEEPISFPDLPDSDQKAVEDDRYPNLTVTGTLVLADLKFRTTDNAGGIVDFDLDHISYGTVRFLSLAVETFAAMEAGSLLILDEFDASLHPLVARAMFNIMNNVELNSVGSQFVVITHDVTLLSDVSLGHDQVGLAEFEPGQGTELYFVSDLKGAKLPREGVLMERYLIGGYGGTPLIKDFSRVFRAALEVQPG